MPSTVTLAIIDSAATVQLIVTDARGAPGASAYQVWLDQGNTGSEGDFLASIAPVSPAAKNRLEQRPDGLYVHDDLTPDPLAYYILAKG